MALISLLSAMTGMPLVFSFSQPGGHFRVADGGEKQAVQPVRLHVGDEGELFFVGISFGLFELNVNAEIRIFENGTLQSRLDFVKKGIAHGLEQYGDADGGAHHEGLAGPIGGIAVLFCEGFDALLDIGMDSAPVMKRPVHRSAGYPEPAAASSLVVIAWLSICGLPVGPLPCAACKHGPTDC